MPGQTPDCRDRVQRPRRGQSAAVEGDGRGFWHGCSCPALLIIIILIAFSNLLACMARGPVRQGSDRRRLSKCSAFLDYSGAKTLLQARPNRSMMVYQFCIDMFWCRDGRLE